MTLSAHPARALAFDEAPVRQLRLLLDYDCTARAGRHEPMTIIYGIKNCDTMKRAFAWLKNNGIEYEFHDYKKAGVTADMLESWASQVGWEKLLNTRGTTWRKLPEVERAGINEREAVKLMQQHPSLIKRPVLAQGKKLLVGFEEKEYKSELR